MGFADDDCEGFDFGMIVIPPFYRTLLETNKVVPFVMDEWGSTLTMRFDSYGVLGLPEEKMEHQRRIDVTGATIIGGVRATIIFGDKINAQPIEKPVIPKECLVRCPVAGQKRY